MIKYIIIIFIIVFIVGYVMVSKQPMSEMEYYSRFLKVIKKSFNNILISITYIPDIDNKTLVRLNNIDDIVDISLRIKKPIYYIEDENKSCDFILINNDEYCIYTLKLNENIISIFDEYYEIYSEVNKKENTKLLEDIDKTTIIKIHDGSSFKVSPMKESNNKKLGKFKKIGDRE